MLNSEVGSTPTAAGGFAHTLGPVSQVVCRHLEVVVGALKKAHIFVYVL